MAIVEMYVVSVSKTHKQYGSGDVIGLKPAEFELYQDQKYKDLVQLLYVDMPNGDRIPADADGKPQPDKKIEAKIVKRDNRLKSAVHRLIRAEGLQRADEERFCTLVLADADKAIVELDKDPDGLGPFIAHVQQIVAPKIAASAMLDRGGRGPARTR